MKNNALLIEEVVAIYDWLQTQIEQSAPSTGWCAACGKCCDFKSYGHRLFLTPPEMIYLAEKLRPEKIKPMSSALCPYNKDGKCEIYEHRFAGCRIFNCKAAADFQSQLSEKTLKKLKDICQQFDIAYHYMDLPTALNK